MRILTNAFLLMAAAASFVARAHDIPRDVLVQAWVRPQHQQLHVLIRVPLPSMRDYAFPERGPGYLDLPRVEPMLNDAAHLWVAGSLHLLENGRPLPDPRVEATRLAPESDRAFASYGQALARFAAPALAPDTQLVAAQTLLDIHLIYPITSAQSKFSWESKLARLGLRTVTAIRYVPPSGEPRAFEFAGDPGLVHLDPSWTQAFSRFVELGLHHILGGIDHLLFLACLVIPVRRVIALVPVVTAFTLAHSITLIAAAYDYAPSAGWFPPLVETLIAASIVYLAAENILGRAGEERWLLAFLFGLVHGFGFSFALRETLQFAGSHLLTSLLSFNLGVEIGQLLVLALIVPLLRLAFVRAAAAERWLTILLSGLVAHTGWHWMIERGAILLAFPFALPELDAAFLAGLFRTLLALAALAGLIAVLRSAFAGKRFRTSA